VSSRTPRYSTRPFAEELALLLGERQLSLRALATRLDLDHSFLSRALRAADGKVLTLDLVRRIATELSVTADYFAEVREALVVEKVRSDGELRDRLYCDLNP
jgi:transcriptional regulator with XRE-family HTH domain